MDVSMNVDSQLLEPGASEDQSQAQTQPLSQPDGSARDETLDAQSWGILIPCVTGLVTVRFLKNNPRATIGRDPSSTLHLPWRCISNTHAVIQWNGHGGNGHSEVTICDKSTNGTWMKGERIGKDMTRVLTDGCELSFGLGGPPLKEEHPEYRFIYRDLVTEEKALYKQYDLSIQLGKGSYARVYKALQRGTGKWVAVKVIGQTMRPNPATSTENYAGREIRIMKEIDHPNVCKLLDVFENPGRSVDLVLEYVDGKTLFHFLNNNHQGTGLTEWMSCHLTYQICKAVGYIHSRHITHRDLKPENILLTRDTPPIVKVADFGLAKLVDEDSFLRTMCGTPAYTAPEIVMRRLPYTDAVDSWSVGVILFLMLTMQTPLPRVSTEELQGLIQKKRMSWDYLDARRDVTDQGRNFVRRLLELDPDDRLSLQLAEFEPWLKMHKHTYEIQYPDDLPTGESLARTESLHSGTSNPVEPPELMRAVTVDPYADDDGARPITRAVTVDPYDDDPYPHAPTRLNPIAETGDLEPRSDVATTGQNLVEPLPGIQGYAQSYSQEEAYIYGLLPAPAQLAVPLPGPATTTVEIFEADRGAQKRMFADMHTAGSSPLSSVGSPPPPRKKGKSTKTGSAGPSSSPRKGKGKKTEESETEKTATRKSTRPARPARR
ncbi:kinase-like domain-containing protein [Mycena maculata]|uniref:Kinase-like domain-containing protein n=1 Tax=Mycena maculata TaxID=230809 RepID=A0AAD7P0D4_9AGAR|nr:kinase-like domain-containing protein [Mycena maculata]